MGNLETLLAGLVIALVSGLVGNIIGKYNKIDSCECDRRQKDCQRLLIEKINNLSVRIEELTTVVNKKLMGI